MRSRLWPVIATALLSLLASCGGEPGVDEQAVAVEPVPFPTSAEVIARNSELVFDSDSDISLGGSRLAPKGGGTWCLEDGEGVRCLTGLAEESAAHGIVWNRSFDAVAITWGGQNPISVLDFEAETVVEASLSTHRLLGWTDDGDLLGLELEWPEKELLRIDPVSLEASAFAPLDTRGVPQLMPVSDELIWGADPDTPALFTMGEDQAPESIDGGLGEQLITSVSQDGRFALTLDNEIARGRGEPDDAEVWVFDGSERRSAGLLSPEGYRSGSINDAQFAPDGSAVMILMASDDGEHDLLVAELDKEKLTIGAWTVLVDSSEAPTPVEASYASNRQFVWLDATTVWLHSGDGEVFEIVLSS